MNVHLRKERNRHKGNSVGIGIYTGGAGKGAGSYPLHCFQMGTESPFSESACPRKDRKADNEGRGKEEFSEP